MVESPINLGPQGGLYLLGFFLVFFILFSKLRSQRITNMSNITKAVFAIVLALFSLYALVSIHEYIHRQTALYFGIDEAEIKRADIVGGYTSFEGSLPIWQYFIVVIAPMLFFVTFAYLLIKFKSPTASYMGLMFLFSTLYDMIPTGTSDMGVAMEICENGFSVGYIVIGIIWLIASMAFFEGWRDIERSSQKQRRTCRPT